MLSVLRGENKSIELVSVLSAVICAKSTLKSIVRPGSSRPLGTSKSSLDPENVNDEDRVTANFKIFEASFQHGPCK